MSEGSVKAWDGPAKSGGGTVDVVDAKHEWESPIFTKLPAVESGSSSEGTFDGSLYS